MDEQSPIRVATAGVVAALLASLFLASLAGPPGGEPGGGGANVQPPPGGKARDPAPGPCAAAPAGPSPGPGNASNGGGAGGGAVALDVWACEGPLGGPPMPVDRRLFSTNLWWHSGWWPERNETWVAMLEAIRPGALRWPAGHPSQDYCWETASGEPWPGCEGWLLTRAQLEAFVALCRDVGAEPLVGVNVKRAPPEMAAAMVNHSRARGLNVTYWHLGNEPDLGGDYGAVERFIQEWGAYSSAMRSEDPRVRLVGPELMTGAHVVGSNGRSDWVRPFLEANPGDVDAISWHLYPLDSENRDPGSPAYPTVEHLVQWWAPHWQPSGVHFIDVAGAKLRGDRDALMPGAELWVTELGPDSGGVGAKGITDGQVAAVWFADALGRFAEGGTDAVFQFAFDHWSARDELSLVVAPPHGDYDPLPPWYVYWLYAEHWGEGVVRTASTDDANVSVHASVREDGAVVAVLVNKGAEARDARLTVHGVGEVAEAGAYEVAAPEPTSRNATVNGHRVDPLRFDATAGAVAPRPAPAAAESAWTLPPYSVTFVVLEPGAG